MSLLTENIRWVQSITLEGERLTADDVVVRRDMLASARIDTFGVRLSFVIVAGLFLVSLTASVSAFLETLQFFEPDYTLFALSLLPLIAFGYGTYWLRPRQHFTIFLRDGSALGVLSRDGNFLTRCLEAFERLWSDPMRAQSSLYVHAAHRSVDFGPPAGGIDVLANTPDEGPMALTLPVFSEDEDAATDENSSPPRSEKPQLVEPDPELSQEPDLPPLPPHDARDDPDDGSEEDDDRTTHVSAALEVDGPVDDEPSDLDEDEGPLPPLPPPFPIPADDEPDGDDDLLGPGSDAPDAGEGELVEEEPEIDDRPFGDHVGVPAAAFVDVRPKVEALVRLLRERAPAQGISDAVDVLELMTRRGCDTPVEVRALARSVQLLGERMSAYPTAVELLESVAEAGHLKNHPAVR
ncbi:MAG: hypothetical protein JJ908_07065 [Rhizobiales bacterium]|nr:hypothetical protein [Hyphomicrobiales bacterium]MBO6697636.1 hypothetical protein [Hyphomicrobiales bacterium]MBO6736109.1 hypothetical protein [Hyphomicrobiales bacterium]MBO6912579.1 hypothetical protein [Hyphomicrobiales bacterium]MBO6956785.1 hypothetical protein [Hyphomicrobiales bacterium]